MTKTLIVTGASAGIGEAVALEMLEAGWTVGLVARRGERLEALADRYGEAAVPPAPRRDRCRRGCRRPSTTSAEAHGRLDCLFNNGWHLHAHGTPPTRSPSTDWRRAVDVNLTGMFLCARMACGLMAAARPAGGRIIMNGSISAHVPRRARPPKTATKHAITGLTKTDRISMAAPSISRVGKIDIGNAETELGGCATAARQGGDGGPAAMPPRPRSWTWPHVAKPPPSVRHMAELAAFGQHPLPDHQWRPGMPYVGRG